MSAFQTGNEFYRNVVLLMSGTIVAQGIPIAITPILTRIYSPDEFGLFALYVGVVSTVSIVASGRYEQAIILEQSDKNAASIVMLSILVSIVTSFLAFLIILFFGGDIAVLLNNLDIEKWLFLVPISMFITGVNQTLSCWLNRNKKYSDLSNSRIVQNTSMVAVQVMGGWRGGLFLLLGDLLGKIFCLSYLLAQAKTSNLCSSPAKNVSRMKLMASKYIKYPTFDVGSSFFNVASFQTQNILFPIIYGYSSAGFYFLVTRILQTPLAIVSSSLTEVYKQKLSDPNTDNAKLEIYYSNMFAFLFTTGLFPLIGFLIYGERLVVIVFGDKWESAGEFAVILAPMFYIRYIASPLSYFVYLKDKQGLNVVGNAALLISSLASILFCESDKSAVLSISILFSFIYLFYIACSFKLSRATP